MSNADKAMIQSYFKQHVFFRPWLKMCLVNKKERYLNSAIEDLSIHTGVTKYYLTENINEIIEL